VIPAGLLGALGLYLVRASALVLFAPIFSAGGSIVGYRVALIAILSVLMYATTGTPLPGDVGPLVYGAMALRELLIGLFLGFLLRVVMLAPKVGGHFIGHEMGFAIASQADPETGVEMPLISRLYENFFLLGLLVVDGHHWLLRGLSTSFERAPVGDVRLSSDLALTLQHLFGEMFEAGLSFAAPVMVLLVLVSILIGLLARAVPYLNILEVSFTVRISLALFAMYLFAPLLEPIMTQLYEQLELVIERSLDGLGG